MEILPEENLSVGISQSQKPQFLVSARKDEASASNNLLPKFSAIFGENPSPNCLNLEEERRMIKAPPPILPIWTN
ncbi:hypothetical protein U1Q18_001267 [Sarracenia purpurea var. burkii]